MLNHTFAIPAVCLACLFSGNPIFAQTYTITTVAGSDRVLDGSAAATVPLRVPNSVAVDSAGSFYIADSADNRIRKVTAAGIISTVAGTGAPGYSGDRGKANLAKISSPSGVAVDSNGNLYFADRGNNRIRKITTDGTINTVAGNGQAGFSGDGSPAAAAKIAPGQLAWTRAATFISPNPSIFGSEKWTSTALLPQLRARASQATVAITGRP